MKKSDVYTAFTGTGLMAMGIIGISGILKYAEFISNGFLFVTIAGDCTCYAIVGLFLLISVSPKKEDKI